MGPSWTNFTGVSQGIVVLPLQGDSSLSASVTTVGATINGPTTTASGLAQVIPQDMTITAISGSFTSSGALGLSTKQLTLKAQLYTAAGNSNIYSPVASGVCTMSAQTGTVASGTIVTCQASSLAIAVTAGTKAFMVVSAGVTGAGANSLVSTAGYVSTTVSAH